MSEQPNTHVQTPAEAHTGPRDVFLQLLTTIGLYAVIISFGSLIFQLIDIRFPDPLTYQYGEPLRSGLRWPLSVLVIVFPLHVWITGKLQKEALADPARREMRIRKWLLYLTLFLAAIVIVVDLISLIFQFLNGSLTTPFVLKVLTALLVAVAVFVYYSWNLKQDVLASRHPKMKFFVWGVVAIVVCGIVFGFVSAGSPQSERIRRFDSRRVNDLQTLQSQIIEYWRVKDKLPESLDLLKDSISGFVPPADPETKEAYGYRVVGDLLFELCAVFRLSSDESTAERLLYSGGPFSAEANWAHSAGRICFTRTIDPDRFSDRPAPLKTVY